MKRQNSPVVLVASTAVLMLVWGCPSVMPPDECAAEAEACTNTDDCCEGLVCAADTCVTPDTGNMSVLPAKSIGLDLMGIHDPESDVYNGDCIGCHGDRRDEVALDGVTPAAHATMASFFGTGNDRCISCHNDGPNFFDVAAGAGTLSRGALREQVDMDAVNCAACHGANAAVALYAE